MIKNYPKEVSVAEPAMYDLKRFFHNVDPAGNLRVSVAEPAMYDLKPKKITGDMAKDH